MDFPFVVELLQYWLEWPPEHELMRTMVGYDPKKQPWRERRAQEVGDEGYVPQKVAAAKPSAKPTAADEDRRMAMGAFGNTKHLDCAPGHIQEAVARFKRGEHLNIPAPK